MSTDYLPKIPIPFDKVKGGTFGDVHEEINPDTTPDKCILTDGENYLWAHRTVEGATTFERFGRNDVGVILDILSAQFDTEFVDEHDEDFQDLVDSTYRGDFITITPEWLEEHGTRVYP